jgi:hypothetical protein
VLPCVAVCRSVLIIAACSLDLPFDFHYSQLGQHKEDVPADNRFLKIGAAAGAHAVDNPAQAADGSTLESDFETVLEQESEAKKRNSAAQDTAAVHGVAGVERHLCGFLGVCPPPSPSPVSPPVSPPYNECSCHADATCTNKKGSQSCECNPGYSGDGKSCRDNNECSSTDTRDVFALKETVEYKFKFTTGTVPHSQSAGKFKASLGDDACAVEFTPAGRGSSIEIVLSCPGDALASPLKVEALSNKDGCFFETVAYSDGLGSSWDFYGPSRVWVDARPFDTVTGTYPCTNALPCDVREFTTWRGTDTCHADATCTNTPGSYTCGCNTGYSGDGKSCTDINECSQGMDTCHADATCTNTPGSYTCGCNAGYSGNGKSCTDIDECSQGTDACHADAACTNTVGDYTCECNVGYGDGFSCSNFHIKTSIGYNTLTLTIVDPTKNFPLADHYKVEAYKKGSATEQLPVHSVHGSTIQQGTNVSLTLENLEPGRRYTMNLTAYNNDTIEVYTTENAMDSTAVTHCGCSDEEYQRTTVNENTESGNAEGSATFTGTPKDFEISQEEGDVMFSFIDDSRCEEGYAFTRNGLAFVPNYFYLAPQPCIATPISPRKKAADDLRDSKLMVYETYTYCVRAVGKE